MIFHSHREGIPASYDWRAENTIRRHPRHRVFSAPSRCCHHLDCGFGTGGSNDPCRFLWWYTVCLLAVALPHAVADTFKAFPPRCSWRSVPPSTGFLFCHHASSHFLQLLVDQMTSLLAVFLLMISFVGLPLYRLHQRDWLVVWQHILSFFGACSFLHSSGTVFPLRMGNSPI